MSQKQTELKVIKVRVGRNKKRSELILRWQRKSGDFLNHKIKRINRKILWQKK